MDTQSLGVRTVLAAAAVAAMGATPVVAQAQGSTVAVTRTCKDITFTPHTEDGPYHIRAKNLTCAAATKQIKAVNAKYENIFKAPKRFTLKGFACTNRVDESDMPMVYLACHRGRRSITWEQA